MKKTVFVSEIGENSIALKKILSQCIEDFIVLQSNNLTWVTIFPIIETKIYQWLGCDKSMSSVKINR